MLTDGVAVAGATVGIGVAIGTVGGGATVGDGASRVGVGVVRVTVGSTSCVGGGVTDRDGALFVSEMVDATAGISGTSAGVGFV